MERLHSCAIVKNCSLESQVSDPSRPLTPSLSRKGRGGVGSLTRFIGRDNKSERAARRAEFSAILAWVLLVSVPLAARAADADTQQVTVHLGDHRFQPETIEVAAGRPVELTLVNDDKITPHNFTLKEPAAGLDLSADVPGGQSSTLHFTPPTAGTYPLYCNKKLPFMKSHRERGMEARLVVKPAS